jgi:restriction system protein
VLTDEGRKQTSISYEQAFEIFRDVQHKVKLQIPQDGSKKSQQDIEELTDQDPNLLTAKDHKDQLRRIVQSFSPSGFERFCARLLRECNFSSVKGTGGPGDGGIDGYAVYMVNQLFGFKVAFQCKRYTEDKTVGSEEVENFRGSLQGKADKGILFTSSRFTPKAKTAAEREGATPIELIDVEKLIELLEQLKLGVIEKETVIIYDIQESFFEEFKYP